MSWSVTGHGTKEELEYFRDFFNARKGQLEKFYCVIDGVKEVVRFGSSELTLVKIRELQNTVGYKCDFSLVRVNTNASITS